MNKELNYNIMFEIAGMLKNLKWQIECVDFQNSVITISKFYSVITIWFNLWDGKLSVEEKHHPNSYKYFELTKSQSECSSSIFEIIKQAIDEFKHENFRLTFVNKYGVYDGHDSFEDHFLPDDKSILNLISDRMIEENSNETLFSFEEQIFQYPNPAIKLRVKRLYEADFLYEKYRQFKGAITFEITRIEYKTEENSYRKVVLDEIKSQKTYYAFVLIKSVNN